MVKGWNRGSWFTVEDEAKDKCREAESSILVLSDDGEIDRISQIWDYEFSYGDVHLEFFQTWKAGLVREQFISKDTLKNRAFSFSLSFNQEGLWYTDICDSTHKKDVLWYYFNFYVACLQNWLVWGLLC